jgi:hypothetical protein
MLSDERIRQIAESVSGTRYTAVEEIMTGIRAALAEAAQVPVVERNQCDGCNRGLQVCDDGLHREPSGHPVMACTRNKYTHSIPATELASLREKAAMVDELQNARISELEFVIEEIIRINHYDFRGHEIAHAAITKERQS